VWGGGGGGGGKPILQRTFKTINDFLIPWLRKPRDRPFFAYVHGVETHAPYVIPPVAPYNQWIDEGYAGGVVGADFNVAFSPERRQAVRPEDAAQLQGLYDGCIRYADRHLGALFDYLHSGPRSEDTIVVFTSDHGEQLLDDGETHGHADVHGGPDETHHIPLILSGPGVPRGAREGRPVESIDILPTLAGLCGLPLSGTVDGLNLLDVHAGKAAHAQVVTKVGDPLAGTLQGFLVCDASAKVATDAAGAARSAWEMPFAAAAPEALSDAGGPPAALLAGLSSRVLPRMRAALAGQQARMFRFSFGNPKLVQRARGAGSRIVAASEGVPPDGAVWRHHVEGRDSAYLACKPGGDGAAPLHFTVPMTPGDYQVLLQLRSPGGEAVPVALVVGGAARGDVAWEAGTPLEDWGYHPAGRFTFKRGFVELRVEAAGPVEIRSVLIHPDVPGAREAAETAFLDPAALEALRRRREELEALGYL
jgi:hypothetical protein